MLMKMLSLKTIRKEEIATKKRRRLLKKIYYTKPMLNSNTLGAD
jgi:hypothetical protein